MFIITYVIRTKIELTQLLCVSECDGTDYQQSSPESGKDSASDCKSDESQASFVRKIASMEMDDSDGTKHSELIPSTEVYSEHSENVENDTENIALPYNPLNPTVYNEQVQKYSNELTCEQKVSGNVRGINSGESCSNESELVSSSNLGNSSVLNEGVVCDIGTCDLAQQLDSDAKTEHSAWQPLPSPRSHIADTEEQIPGEEPLVHALACTSGSSPGVFTQTDEEPLMHANTQTHGEPLLPANTQTPYSDTYREEQTVIRQTMEAAVETLRTQNLEPVISLHYSSEGTTNSTITLGFASFENLQTQITTRPPDLAGSQTSVGNVLSSRENVDDLTQEPLETQNIVTNSENGDALQSSTSEATISNLEADKTDRDSTSDVRANVDIGSESINNISGNDLEKCEISVKVDEVKPCSSGENPVNSLPSSSSDILPFNQECTKSPSSNLASDINVPNTSAILGQPDEQCRGNEIIEAGSEDNNLTTDSMLHTGIVVSAVDDNISDRTHNDNEVDLQQHSVDNVLVEKSTESDLGKPGVSGTQNSVPNSEITSDSQANVETSPKTVEVMEGDNDSEFERVIDQVLATSDESDGQTNISASRDTSETAVSMEVDEPTTKTSKFYTVKPV